MYRITQEDLDFISKIFVLKTFTGNNDDAIWVFSENVPEYIVDKIIQDSDWHNNDSIYRFGRECIVDFIDNAEVGEYEYLDEIFGKVRDALEADDYTSDLTEWLNERNDNVYYLTEVLEDGIPEDGFTLLQDAQVKHKNEIYTIIFNMLEWYLEVEVEDKDEDEDE